MANFMVEIEGSGRHVHLTDEASIALFGTADLPQKRALTIPGAFVYDVKVDLVGTDGKTIKGVGVLGPHRKDVQVELSFTDARLLGIEPPVRNSGDTKGSAPITIVGPKGKLECKEGAIVANRHIHMSPADAAHFGVKDGDYIDVDVFSGTKRTRWFDVQIRASEKFTLEMHVDTDDANAVGIKNGSTVTIAK